MLIDMAENAFLRINNLKKYFDDVKAVDGLSFSIKPGEIYGLLGPNGAGKTTTVKCMLGLLEPDEGNIDIFGLNPLKDELKIKDKIGYVSEEPLLYKSLTPKEFFNFIASVRGLDEEKTERIVRDLLESLQAIEFYNSPIVTLSKGNKQKIQIISSLIHDPQLLIMDEPLAGLDARSNRVVKDILRIHIDTGGSVLLSTHILEVAQDLCDRIGIINEGKMIAEGSLDQLRRIAEEAGAASLEDVFLKLTNENESVHNVVEKLKETI